MAVWTFRPSECEVTVPHAGSPSILQEPYLKWSPLCHGSPEDLDDNISACFSLPGVTDERAIGGPRILGSTEATLLRTKD